MADKLYISSKPKLKFPLYVDRGGDEPESIMIRFENGSFTSEDEAVTKAIDKALDEGTAICQFVRRVDVENAERIAAEFAKELQEQAAVKGAMTSEDIGKLARKRLAIRDEILAQHAALDPQHDAKMKAQAEDAGLTMTETAHPSELSPEETGEPTQPEEGFKPTEASKADVDKGGDSTAAIKALASKDK